MKQDSSIIWHKLDKFVLRGTKVWDLTVAFKSPCVNLNTPNMIYNNEIYSICQRSYEEEIISPFENMCSSSSNQTGREKRQAFAAGMVSEYIITSLVETIRGYFSNRKEHTNAERISLIDSELGRLNNHLNEA